MAETLKPGDAVASIGYPLIPDPNLRGLLGDKCAGLRYRRDSAEICEALGVGFFMIPDSESFFGLFGASLDVFGPEGIELDLNKPFPENSRGQYDYVIDCGALGNCFDVPQAAHNIAGLVKAGGLITHESPFNCGNEVYYSLHPKWFHDFYKANGFEVVDCYLTKEDGISPMLNGERFEYIGPEATLITTARRNEVGDFIETQKEDQ